MAQLKIFALLLFIFLSSVLLLSSAAAAAEAHEERQGQELSRTWQRKLWMNHGSFRGPRKHLVNLTVDQHPFQVRELRV
ncbi:hypothetical protein LOK49_LG13G01955 [Camellia lanceoleosa]|uniref:Uncharacterized protein n=1 Tax=Camellia lanceoleosa TaxID=1840588 RepID=A0ACC0FLJ4_9ERIC|nr:hypothetical protein LOK49_LG13G01955 [Camellia lanceoleosa]